MYTSTANVTTVSCNHRMALVCMDKMDRRMSFHNLAIVLFAKPGNSCNSMMEYDDAALDLQSIFFAFLYVLRFFVFPYILF